jgi:apolipoprotein N-acyltransferase
MAHFLKSLTVWFNSQHRFWLPPLLGVFYTSIFAPFGPLTHPALVIFPIAGFFILVPFFAFATQRSFKRAAIDSYTFGVMAFFGQFYWIKNVGIEGLQAVVLGGLFAATLFFALYFLCAGMMLRLIVRFFPRLVIGIFPAVWILLEYVRGNGEIGFPWNFIGYSIAQIPALAQSASFWGVYGLSFVVVAVNVAVWNVLRTSTRDTNKVLEISTLLGIGCCICLLGVWGTIRMKSAVLTNTVSVGIIQPNIDQAQWDNQSLDASVDVIERLVYETATHKPAFMVLPESSLFCYFLRHPWVHERVVTWVDSTKIPLLFGSLHWENGSRSEYIVYNTAFLKKPHEQKFEYYYKMGLLPFSETMPFKSKIPILNRLNLGQSDFSAGTDPKIFAINDSVSAGPFICYEMIFPAMARQRANAGASMFVNITNDGWWGRSTGPYQHSLMTTLRAVENGIPLVRCANSGVSLVTDAYGRVLDKTTLYTRTILYADVPTTTIKTSYRRYGDWPLGCAIAIALAALIGGLILRLIPKRK